MVKVDSPLTAKHIKLVSLTISMPPMGTYMGLVSNLASTLSLMHAAANAWACAAEPLKQGRTPVTWLNLKHSNSAASQAEETHLCVECCYIAV